MEKVSFRVSARAARLIGRENIASSKGAIIELVKNAYDADSKACIVYFDNFYSKLHEELNEEQYNYLIKNDFSLNFLEEIYSQHGNVFIANNDISNETLVEYLSQASFLNKVYIIDCGEGMTYDVIKEHWMTIGTNNKVTDVFTKSGRVKSGAKGIGRFALDKLGDVGEMYTVYDKEKYVDSDETASGYHWKVDWRDFEGDFKTIDKINANVEVINFDRIGDNIIDLIPHDKITELTKGWDTGTVLKISNTRDNWSERLVSNVYSDLEVLVPPKEINLFKIYLYSSLNPEKYGEILGSVCDDYDYKLTATYRQGESVKVKIFRNEYDFGIINPHLFTLKEMQKFPHRKKDFKKGSWEKELRLENIIPGFKKVDYKGLFDQIGDFDFHIYYMKRGYSTTDLSRFNYRKFNSRDRKDWLNDFGGIKLFRDNFRVRPYGDIGDSSFDWLGLGLRKSQNQAGIAKPEGGWKVEPENIAGSVFISRLANVNFEDKSSREGLQENEVFNLFKKVILGIINEIEVDRALIARNMKASYDFINRNTIDREKAEDLASSIIKNNEENGGILAKSDSSEVSSEEVDKLKNQNIVLANLNKDKNEQLEKLEKEQSILRVMASTGIVMAAFSHDLSKLSNLMDSRVGKVIKLIGKYINEDDVAELGNRKNPYYQLEKIRKQDVKLQNWLQFSLGSARKDKRKRTNLNLKSYFYNLGEDWFDILENRAISFDIRGVQDISIRALEIDFDSMFFNLLVNSIDAFTSSTIDRKRKIIIKIYSNKKEIVIDYRDTGPGITDDFADKEDIFDALETSKKNKDTGDDEGTGLGMWLVDTIIKDYDGKRKLLFDKPGFGIRFELPSKYKRK